MHEVDKVQDDQFSASDSESDGGGEKTGDFGSKNKRASLIGIEIPEISINSTKDNNHVQHK